MHHFQSSFHSSFPLPCSSYLKTLLQNLNLYKILIQKNLFKKGLVMKSISVDKLEPNSLGLRTNEAGNGISINNSGPLEI